MKRRDDRDEEVKPIARQIEQLARAPQYVPRGYRIGDYGNHTERRSERDVVIIDSQAPRATQARANRYLFPIARGAWPSGNLIC